MPVFAEPVSRLILMDERVKEIHGERYAFRTSKSALKVNILTQYA